MDFSAFIARSAGYGTIKVHLARICLAHIKMDLCNPLGTAHICN